MVTDFGTAVILSKFYNLIKWINIKYLVEVDKDDYL